MKQYLFRAALALAGLLAVTPAAVAQDLVVHIQQEFVAGGKTLPAGDYTITKNIGGGGQVLMLRGTRSGAVAFLVPVTQESPVEGRNQVTLLRDGDALYLQEIASDRGVFTLAAPASALKKRDLGTASGK